MIFNNDEKSLVSRLRHSHASRFLAEAFDLDNAELVPDKANGPIMANFVPGKGLDRDGIEVVVRRDLQRPFFVGHFHDMMIYYLGSFVGRTTHAESGAQSGSDYACPSAQNSAALSRPTWIGRKGPGTESSKSSSYFTGKSALDTLRPASRFRIRVAERQTSHKSWVVFLDGSVGVSTLPSPYDAFETQSAEM
jgi:hypothetical protein